MEKQSSHFQGGSLVFSGVTLPGMCTNKALESAVQVEEAFTSGRETECKGWACRGGNGGSVAGLERRAGEVRAGGRGGHQGSQVDPGAMEDLSMEATCL